MYDAWFGPRVSVHVPSVIAPTPAPLVSIDLPISIRRGKHTTTNHDPIYNFLSY